MALISSTDRIDAAKFWRASFRRIAPLLPRAGLVRLSAALASKDPHLVKGRTADTLKAGTNDTADVCGCAVAFPFIDEVRRDYADVDDFLCALNDRFDVVFFAASDDAVGGESPVHFLNWFDYAPWPVVREKLPAEIDLYLASTADPEDAAEEPIVVEGGAA